MSHTIVFAMSLFVSHHAPVTRSRNFIQFFSKEFHDALNIVQPFYLLPMHPFDGFTPLITLECAQPPHSLDYDHLMNVRKAIHQAQYLVAKYLPSTDSQDGSNYALITSKIINNQLDFEVTAVNMKETRGSSACNLQFYLTILHLLDKTRDVRRDLLDTYRSILNVFTIRDENGNSVQAEHLTHEQLASELDKKTTWFFAIKTDEDRARGFIRVVRTATIRAFFIDPDLEEWFDYVDSYGHNTRLLLQRYMGALSFL